MFSPVSGDFQHAVCSYWELDYVAGTAIEKELETSKDKAQLFSKKDS